MTKEELNKYKHILEAKQAELETFVRNREGIAIEKSPDALDEVQHAAERELAIHDPDCESPTRARRRVALHPKRRGSFRLRCLRDSAQKFPAPPAWPPGCVCICSILLSSCRSEE